MDSIKTSLRDEKAGTKRAGLIEGFYARVELFKQSSYIRKKACEVMRPKFAEYHEIDRALGLAHADAALVESAAKMDARIAEMRERLEELAA